LYNTAREKFDSVKNAAQEKFDAAKRFIVDPIKDAVDKVKGFIDKIKGFFSDLKLKIPKPEMPKMVGLVKIPPFARHCTSIPD
ncbi:hypothetical protein ACUOFC_62935, partial [Escherichia sp. TWPC-MK]